MSPTPSQLWHQADKEYPNDVVARTVRYQELMRAAGLIVKRELDDRSPLFACGLDLKKPS